MPTGRPAFFRCAKCRASSSSSRVDGWKWTLTGRTRPKRTDGGRGWHHAAYEYSCLACGHVGWSRNPDCANRATFADDPNHQHESIK